MPIFGHKAHFIGGHPMAGSEKFGIEAARGNLFENAVWVLTPTAETPEEAVAKMTALIEGLGATPLLLNAAIHDKLLAVTSHLPHITAAALVHLFIESQDEYTVAQQLIATGWRDSTRIAAGSPEMWRDICLHNAPALKRSLNDLMEQLHDLRDMLEEENGEKLLAWFDKASTARRKQGYFPRAK